MGVISNYLIYEFNDQSVFFYQVYAEELPSFFIGSVDFLLMWIIKFFSGIFDGITCMNILLISFSFINFIFTFLLFNKLNKNKILSIVFSIFYSFSLYFIFRVISATPNFYSIFMFPMVVYLLLENRHPLCIGVVCLILFCLGSYHAFFVTLMVLFWYFTFLVSKDISFKEFCRKICIFLLPIVVGISLLFSPILLNNFPLFGRYKYPSYEEMSGSIVRFYRPIEDWYNLSFRPWYFFIPPKSSIFFGDLSKNIYDKIESTGYYLADDYMEQEMGGSYMGWHFLLGMAFVAVLLLLKRYKNKEFKTFKTVYENKEMILRSFFIIFCILLISGPPSFTIHGIEIYTPTYLLYHIVPVFRTLVRWAVVIYLFVLIINSFLIQDLYNLMKTKFQKILFILGFLGLNFVIFAIKIPVINIEKPPVEIAYVKEKYPESVSYAVYPKGDYYSIFWIISHEDLLINPVNFVNYETGFNANEFSKKLITEEGIQDFLKQNPKYLIYYPEKISDDDLEKISEINPDIHTHEDIYEFFKQKIGESIKIGESFVFEVRK